MATSTTSLDYDRATDRSDGLRPGALAAVTGRLLFFVDNLRWIMIILVISMHAADTYSPLGNWYLVDRTKLGMPPLLVFAAWQMYLQAFFMGLLFFIAGYFVPSSFDRDRRVPNHLSVPRFAN